MPDNVIRFPGFLTPDDRNGCWKDGQFHKSFRAMVKALPERDRIRSYRWNLKREGQSYRTAELAGIFLKCADYGAA
jgi:hypothetical protein